MSAAKSEIEVTGVDVEEAVASGLARLGLPREKVAIEVVDEGSRGLLGLGRRPAIVRMRPITPDSTAATRLPKAQVRAPEAPARPVEQRPKVEKAPTPKAEAPAAPVRREAPVTTPKVEPLSAAKEEPVELTDELLEEAEVAKEIWETLLGQLGIDAAVAIRSSEPDERNGRRIAILDVRGRDLSLLIGPRGETLNAMQYVTRLMVAHRLKRRAYFVADVEGYRDRRTQALARLAERMARKALKRGRPVTLEPMPPNERRAVHMALRDIEGVYTQSTGEGDSRRVRILLEK